MILIEFNKFALYFCCFKVLEHFRDKPYKDRRFTVAWKNKPLINWSFE